MKMASTSLLHLLLGALALLISLVTVKGESPYKYYTWTVTYGIISPLGVPQQVQQLQFPFIETFKSLFDTQILFFVCLFV